MKKLFSVLCALVILSVILKPVPVKSAEPECRTASWVLMESETRHVITGSCEDVRVPAGTLNKLMTVLIAAEAIADGELSPDAELTASETAHNASGAVIWLDAGEKITVSELMKALIIGNAGDAAVVLAERISGSCESFTGLMNFRARELGMKDTVFTSPYSTDDENQYTTARDAAVLAAEVSAHTELHDTMMTWLDYVRDGKTQLVNENTLIRTYEGVKGVKAWHTEKSGFCAAVSAERNGGKYTAVILGCEDSEERFKFAKSLLKQGFSGYCTVIPGFSAEYMKPLKVKQGTERAVSLLAEELVPLVIPRGTEDSLRVVTVEPDYINAPVEKGQKIGTAAFYLDRTLLYETSLIAADSVPKNTFGRSLKKIIVKMFKE